MSEEIPLSETQAKVLRMVARAPNRQRQIAGHGMGPYLSAANALMRKGLLGSYRTGHFYLTTPGGEVAERLLAEYAAPKGPTHAD